MPQTYEKTYGMASRELCSVTIQQTWPFAEREGKIAYGEEESWRVWGFLLKPPLQRHWVGGTVKGNPSDGSHVASKSVSLATFHALPAELQIATSLQAEVYRCFSLIKTVINTCQSNGLGWERDSTLITKTIPQEVFSV